MRDLFRAGLVSVAGLAIMAGLWFLANRLSGPHQPDDSSSFSAAQTPAPASPEPADPRVVAAHNRFGFRLFSLLARGAPGSNVFYSPASVSMALAMTYNGAAGATKEGMAKALSLEGLTLDDVNRANGALIDGFTSGDPKVETSIANSLWAQKGVVFEPDFLQANRTSYRAEVDTLDFGNPASAQRINGWVSDRTRGKIDKLFDRLDPSTAMVLVNAVYFHGKWTRPFDPKLTTDRPFTLGTGQTADKPTMVQTGRFPYYRDGSVQAIRLPYGDGRFSMIVVLPNTDSGLPALVDSLTPEKWEAWMRGLRTAKGTIWLPRFRIRYRTALNKPLRQMGMQSAFSADADFRAMSREPVFISLVQHEAYVDVNEEGTEAAAATGAVMTRVSVIEEPPFEMNVDHPFLCAIRDNTTGETLFLGAVYDPTAG